MGIRDTDADAEVSLLDLAGVLLKHRRTLLLWVSVTGMLAVLLTFFETRQFTSTASFVPNGPDDTRSSLGGIAAQLGVVIPRTGAVGQSPQFYAELIRSRALLTPIADDTFVVSERGGQRVALVDILRLSGSSAARIREAAIARLAGDVVRAAASRETGVVSLWVTTPLASVSQAIAAQLVTGLNDFNLRSRQSQAAAERRFIEQRLAMSRDSLRRAEDRAESFLRANREYRNSPQLVFAYDRLQRDVALQQQVFSTLSQSYEDARIREVRDTPLITIIDSPRVPTSPGRLRRALHALIGMIVGGVFGMVFVFASETLTRRRAAGDPRAEEVALLLADIKEDVYRLMPPWRARARG